MAYVGNDLTVQQYAPQIAYFSGNASTTAFTLPQAVVSSAQILVFVANVPQNPSSAYTVSGTTLTFTSAPPTGTNNVWVEYTSLQTNTVVPSYGTVGPSQINSAYSLWNLSGTDINYTAGNVGIGTVSPASKFEVSTGGGTKLRVTSTIDNNADIDFYTNSVYRGIIEFNSVGGLMYTIPSLPLTFGTNNTERMRIDSSGNLLVGSSAAYSGTEIMRLTRGGVNWFTGPNSTNGGFDILKDGTTGVYLSSGATSWAGLSDETMKDIIEPIENATEKVSTLRAVIGKYKTDEEETRRAFLIAQDVQKVLPEAVNENSEGKLGLQYTDVIPLLVAAIQEQQVLIESLTTRLTALEAK